MDPDEALDVVADLDVDAVEARWLRAIGEYMSILKVNDAVAKVVSESGRTYLVNPTQGWCDCPDRRHRDVECKHLKRVAAEWGVAGEALDEVSTEIAMVDEAIDEEVTRLEARIDELRAAQRIFGRLNDRITAITPGTEAAPDPDSQQGVIADD